MLLSLFLKSILMIFKGVLIGVSLSAPLGPVGSLCLHKTLFNGRRDGLLTGYGATVSDVLYSAIVYVFFGSIFGFFESNPEIMAGLKSFGSVLGGIILMIFARLLFLRGKRYNNENKVEEQNGAKDSFKKFVSAFLITFSNFWIIFLIWSLYLALDFVIAIETAMDYYLMFVGLIGVSLGCLMWWYFFTDIIIRISNSLGDKGIKWFVFTISIILGVVGWFSIILGLNTITSINDVLDIFTHIFN